MTKKINARWNKVGLNTTEPHKRKQDSIKIGFWDYYIDHCCCCDDRNCICKASTTKDTLVVMRDITMDPIQKRLLQEALDKD